MTKSVGLTGRYGTPSLRKTLGYMARVIHHKDLPQIIEKLGHSNRERTKRYMGTTQEEMNELEREVCIQQAGHKRLETTQIYSDLAPEQMRDAYEGRG